MRGDHITTFVSTCSGRTSACSMMIFCASRDERLALVEIERRVDPLEHLVEVRILIEGVVPAVAHVLRVVEDAENRGVDLIPTSSTRD